MNLGWQGRNNGRVSYLTPCAHPSDRCCGRPCHRSSVAMSQNCQQHSPARGRLQDPRRAYDRVRLTAYFYGPRSISHVTDRLGAALRLRFVRHLEGFKGHCTEAA